MTTIETLSKIAEGESSAVGINAGLAGLATASTVGTGIAALALHRKAKATKNLKKAFDTLAGKHNLLQRTIRESPDFGDLQKFKIVDAALA